MVRALTIFIVGLAGCSSGNRPSGAPDMAKATGPDSGFSLQPVSLNTLAMAPEPFSSNVQPSDQILFTADIPQATSLADVESSIVISNRGDSSRLVGTFDWSQVKVGVPDPEMKTIWRAVFRPSVPLKNNTDYVVSLVPKGTFSPAWAFFPDNVKTAKGTFSSVTFSVGSHPIVQSVNVVSKDGGKSARYARIRFSEGIATNKLVNGSISFFQSGHQLDVVVTDPVSIYWNSDTPIREVECTFTNPPSLVDAIQVNVSGKITSPTGVPLYLATFDSSTSFNGQFVVLLDKTTAKVADALGLRWYPTVIDNSLSAQ